MQHELSLFTDERAPESRSSAELNRLAPEDRAVHDWYRFVLSYPPHVVRDYLQRFGVNGDGRVLDPFSGSGTTVVECRKRSIAAIGLEAHPMSHFAGATKIDWSVDPARLRAAADRIASAAQRQLQEDGVTDQPQWEEPAAGDAGLRRLPEDQARLLLKNSISPRPLHKVLVLRDALAADSDAAVRPHLRLALARALVGPVGNLHFGPEVGVGPPKPDAAVIATWRQFVEVIAMDLEELDGRNGGACEIRHADAREAVAQLEPESIDAVITSPPYPNEKDYTRTTRLESVLLGFISSRAELQALKKSMLLRSNTRGVYVGDADDALVADHAEIQRIARAIEERRIALGKTSGFERLYARVTKLYFGGMVRHFAALRPALRPGARLAYVVGDQASFLRVMIRTGQLLASLAERLGYQVERIDLFRTRIATATKEQLREEVVVLRWPGR